MSAALTELRESLGPDHFFVAVVQNELGDLYIRGPVASGRAEPGGGSADLAPADG